MIMQKFSMFGIFVGIVFVWCVLPSCNLQSSGPAHLPLVETGNRLALFSSADTRGSLEPCGCKSGQMGGLPRQAQYFLQHRASEDILADLGNSMSEKVDPYELFKWYYILLTYQKMGYDAINLGQYEIQISAEELQKMCERVTVPLVSCNVVDSQGQYLVKPYVIKSSGAIKIAITGMVSPEFAKGNGIEVKQPKLALQETLPAMMQESHLVIVLANMPEALAREIAQDFPEIGILLVTGAATTMNPQKVGPVVLSSLTDLGRYVQKLEFGFRQAGELSWLKGTNIRLGDDIQDHAGTVHLLNRYRQELAEKRFYTQGRKSSEKYAGAAKCAMCHSEIYASWKATAHSHSLDSLKAKHNEHDPGCLQCHVTGLGLETGYISEVESPDMAMIGCEVCHGPSARHSKPSSAELNRPSTGNPLRKETCLECHTWEHCENFDFDTFWAKLKHPKMPTQR